MGTQHENWTSIAKALICPACSQLVESTLSKFDNKIVCTNKDCGQTYLISNEIPRLITKSGDFMNEKDIEEFAPTYKNT